MINQAQNETIVAESVLSRLQEALGADSDAQIARELRISPSTISSWRARGTIPYEAAVEIAQNKGFSLDWLVLGRGPKMAIESSAPTPTAYGPQPPSAPIDISTTPQGDSRGPVDVNLLVEVMDAIEKNATMSALPREQKSLWTGRIYDLCQFLHVRPNAVVRNDREG